MRPAPDPLADAREAGLRVEIADLGRWSPVVLVSEYDCDSAVIRVNAALLSAVERNRGEDAATNLLRTAVAHELYHHRVAKGLQPRSRCRYSLEMAAHAFARRRYGLDPELVLGDLR